MAKLSIGQDTLRRKKMNNRKRVISNMKIKYIDHKERMSSLNCEDKVPMIRFDALEEFPFIRHGFSTRLGGISSGIYASMNLSFNRGDDDQKVMKNYELIAEELGTSTTHMVAAKQTHTTNVLKVGSDRCGMGITEKRDFDDIDGLITNEPGVCLVTAHADCVPLFFVDPARKCIGLSHSGWRGTVGKIAVNTVKKMQENYGSNPADLIGVIGPSICKDCYEVSEDVADEFKKAYNTEQAQDILDVKGNGKYQLDLHQANVYNMLEAGMKRENIHVTDLCTCCNPELLFSHRASHGKRGVLCGFLELI